jgi:two-component system invasion response regulator UvrY
VIKVLVADDHAVVRRGLRQILSETDDVEVAAEAATGAEVLERIRTQRFNVVVLDLNLGGTNGLELLVDIHRERPELPVLILTVYSEEQYAVRALRAGAAGFLTKESAPDKLLEAVRKIAAGGRWVSVELAERLADWVAHDRNRMPHEALSDREFQVLKMLASGKTVSQVAEELALSVKTISTHRMRILKKMAMKNNAELTHYAVRNGLVE